jgi:hypothetical protein
MRRSALPSVWPKAALERFCDQRRKTDRVSPRSYLELVGADKFLPIFLDRHCFTHAI